MSIAQGEDAGDFTQHLPSFAELNRFTSYNISFYPTLTLLTYLTSWFLTTGGSFFYSRSDRMLSFFGVIFNKTANSGPES